MGFRISVFWFLGVVMARVMARVVVGVCGNRVLAQQAVVVGMRNARQLELAFAKKCYFFVDSREW